MPKGTHQCVHIYSHTNVCNTFYLVDYRAQDQSHLKDENTYGMIKMSFCNAYFHGVNLYIE